MNRITSCPLVDSDCVVLESGDLTRCEIEEAKASTDMTVPFLDINSNVASSNIVAELYIVLLVISCHGSSEDSASINPRITRSVITVLESPGFSPLAVAAI